MPRNKNTVPSFILWYCSFGPDLMWILQKLVNVTQTTNKLCSGISDAYACGSWSRAHSPSDHFIQGHTNWDVVCGSILNRKSKFRLWLWISMEHTVFISTVAKYLCSSWFRVPADNMRTKLPEETCQSQNVCCKEDAVSQGHIEKSCSQTASLKVFIQQHNHTHPFPSKHEVGCKSFWFQHNMGSGESQIYVILHLIMNHSYNKGVDL